MNHLLKKKNYVESFLCYDDHHRDDVDGGGFPLFFLHFYFRFLQAENKRAYIINSTRRRLSSFQEGK